MGNYEDLWISDPKQYQHNMWSSEQHQYLTMVTFPKQPKSWTADTASQLLEDDGLMVYILISWIIQIQKTASIWLSLLPDLENSYLSKTARVSDCRQS